MEAPPLLIRRVAQGKLALAISWFLGVPAFVFGVATILWPIQHLPIGDCLRADCTNPEAPTLVAPFVAPAMIALIGLAVGSLLLYRLTYRQERLAWWIVGAIGVGLLGTALAADAVARAWESVIFTFVWPVAPGLMATDAAWHGLRSRSPALG